MTGSRSARGFSLLETLIALGLIGVLVGTIALFVNQLAGSRAQLRATTGREALATAIFDGLERALMTSIARTGTGAPGIVGTSQTLYIAHDGVVVSRVFGDVPQSVLEPESILRFEFDASSGETRLRRDDSSASLPGISLGAVRFRYLSDGRWFDSWDSFASEGLPAAIECSIWWVSPFDETGDDEGTLESEDVDFDAFDSSADDRPNDPQSIPPDRLRLMRVPDGGVSADEFDADPLVEDPASFEEGSFQGGAG